MSPKGDERRRHSHPQEGCWLESKGLCMGDLWQLDSKGIERRRFHAASSRDTLITLEGL
jgi:hypothetical protein